MCKVKIQMYNRQTFQTEDHIRISKNVLQNEKCYFLFQKREFLKINERKGITFKIDFLSRNPS